MQPFCDICGIVYNINKKVPNNRDKDIFFVNSKTASSEFYFKGVTVSFTGFSGVVFVVLSTTVPLMLKTIVPLFALERTVICLLIFPGLLILV